MRYFTRVYRCLVSTVENGVILYVIVFLNKTHRVFRVPSRRFAECTYVVSRGVCKITNLSILLNIDRLIKQPIGLEKLFEKLPAVSPGIHDEI